MGQIVNRRRVLGSGGGGIAGYLTIVSMADGNTIKFFTSDGSNTRSIDVSTDGRIWETKVSSTTGTTLTTLDNGEKLFVKGVTSSYADSTYFHYFEATVDFALQGNIMSMLYGDSFEGETVLPSATFTFRKMFAYQDQLVDISNLVMPATTLRQGCYEEMFRGTGITSLPEGLLPATTLAVGCYQYMFLSSSVASVPSNLLPATTLANSCYRAMFSTCASLTAAPDLPAGKLVAYCYRSMFYQCSSIKYMKCLATSGLSTTECTQAWLTGNPGGGTFYAKSGVSWASSNSGIPSNWTRVNV